MTIEDTAHVIAATTEFNAAVNKRSDALINYFLLGYVLLGLIFATFFDTWVIAIGVGGLCLIAYYSVRIALPDSDLSHYVLSAILGVFMAQYIYQMHGLFEMHFFAFIGSAILITYQNWKLQIPMLAIVVIHHAAFGYLQYVGFEIYFTRVDYFDIQTFIIHVALAGVIFFICGLWSYQLKKNNLAQVYQTVEIGKMQKEVQLSEERKKNEVALQEAYLRAEKAREEAESANRAKSVFLATMSHEIRTPMNGVLGMAALLGETTMTTEQKEYADTIRVSGEALLTVINDILDFSKIESGNLELDSHAFDLRQCIEDVMDVFSAKMTEKNLDLVYQIDHQIPAVIVGDSHRIHQVLLNLIGNAIKFTHQGEIFVGIDLLKMEGGQLELAFQVRDTGIGIPEDKLPRLFKAFSRVDSSTTRKYGGTGLGLVISQKLVELMGGVIDVESQPNIGTSFGFTIKALSSQESSRQYAHTRQVSWEGRRVLVVDDNATNLRILKLQLEQWKMQPLLASSGNDALKFLASGDRFDLVITDMQMPDMDGVQLTTAIKANYPSLPVILLSSIGDDSRRLHAKLFFAVLNKPAKQQNLNKMIAAALRPIQEVAALDEQKPLKVLSDKFALMYPLRILIAEDNLVNQKLTTRVLGKLGYHNVALATNGIDAVEKFSEQCYDVILMDVQMPRMDGLEATRMIRLKQYQQPYIISMTANAMQGDREACLQAGMNDYMSKPIKLEDVMTVLEKAFAFNQLTTAGESEK